MKQRKNVKFVYQPNMMDAVNKYGWKIEILEAEDVYGSGLTCDQLGFIFDAAKNEQKKMMKNNCVGPYGWNRLEDLKDKVREAYAYVKYGEVNGRKVYER